MDLSEALNMTRTNLALTENEELDLKKEETTHDDRVRINTTEGVVGEAEVAASRMDNSIDTINSFIGGGNNANNNNIDDEEASIVNIEKEATSKKQPWKEIFLLSFSSLGAIYGDLGTSPLYTLNSIKYSQLPPNKNDIYGAISIIFWVFTIIVIFKYVCIVLMLGPNNGEGGQVAIYAKIARYLNIGPKGVTIPGGTKSMEASDLQLLKRQDTTASSINTVQSRIERIKQHPTIIRTVQSFILGACFLGCSLVMSDGLLTPTTSVLSAIGGIQIAVPSFSNTSVLAVSEVILIILFAIQQFGSKKISFLFAPIIFIWMIGLIICGTYNIAKYHPGIFAALSPHHAIRILQNGGIDVFGGAMLAITGTEAMFADIGHFGKLPIQITLTGFVYPALILCYLGQGAYLVNHPEAYTNPFFLSLPGGTGSGVYWLMFVLATLSTIIASQALILSVFSIISQLINLDCFPKLKIVHVSSQYAGKVYIPTINWLLMIGVICTTAGFKNSNNVTAAYGLGISLDFIVTSSLLVICMFYVYNANIVWPILFCLIFVPLEACMVIANLKKIPHGAWFPILMTGVAIIFLATWRWARSRKVNQEFEQRVRIEDLYPHFAAKRAEPVTLDLRLGEAIETTPATSNLSIQNPIQSDATHGLNVNTRYGVCQLQKHKGVGFMYADSFITSSPNTLPNLYAKLIESFASIPTQFIFVGIRVLSVPYIDEEDRVLMAPMKLEGHYKCILRFGFMEEIVITESLAHSIMQRVPALSAMSYTELSLFPIFHYFENDLIRCHKFQSTSSWKLINWIRRCGYEVQKLAINNIYSPLRQITQDHGQFVHYENREQEMKNKIFLGGIARI